MPRRAPDRRRLAAAVLTAALAAGLAGCEGSVEPPSKKPAQTYELPAREVRPDERPLRIAGKDGDTTFEVIGLTSGLKTLVGSHAEFPAKGRFLRLRMVVSNTGRSSVLFSTKRLRLILADDAVEKPDSPAMLVKRQPDGFDLGPAMRVEFDLYFDVPVGAKAKALRAFGGPTLTDLTDKEHTDIPLTR